MGPFGAYIKKTTSDGSQVNIPLPKALKSKWETISLEECIIVVDKNANRKPRGKPQGNKSTSTFGKTKAVPKANAKAKAKAKPIVNVNVNVNVNAEDVPNVPKTPKIVKVPKVPKVPKVSKISTAK